MGNLSRYYPHVAGGASLGFLIKNNGEPLGTYFEIVREILNTWMFLRMLLGGRWEIPVEIYGKALVCSLEMVWV